MKTFRWRQAIAALFLVLLVVTTGCAKTDTSPYAQVQKETTEKGAAPAVVKDAEQGSSFNKFFPKDQQGYNVVYTQEKKGFAEAKLKSDGKDVAMLSVSDTKSLPQAAQKYQGSTEKLNGYPVLEIGSTQTGVLVGDRYQVKVQSRDASFTKEDRRAWLQKFDLKGIAGLK